MSEQDDKIFLKRFSLIIAGLVVVAVALVFAGIEINKRLAVSENLAQGEATPQRIKPVFDVYTDQSDLAAAETPAENASDSQEQQMPAQEAEDSREAATGRRRPTKQATASNSRRRPTKQATASNSRRRPNKRTTVSSKSRSTAAPTAK